MNLIKQIDLNNSNQFSVTAAQMARVDEIAINEFGIDLLQMMEPAGKQLAALCAQSIKRGDRVLILAGPGHNGGGGLVAAKYLFNQGYQVSVFLTSKELKPITKRQLEVLEKLSIPILTSKPPLSDFSLIVDTMLGYNIKGPVKEPVKSMVKAINTSKIPTISLDLPSGLNPDTGKPEGAAVKATATLTLAAAKKGFFNPKAKQYLGDLYLANIGIPQEVFKKL